MCVYVVLSGYYVRGGMADKQVCRRGKREVLMITSREVSPIHKIRKKDIFSLIEKAYSCLYVSSLLS